MPAATPPSASAAATAWPTLPLPFANPDFASTAPPTAHLHVVLPYAAQLDASCQHVLGTLALPHLERLLAKLRPAAPDLGDEASPIPPHERAVASTWGLNPEAPQWAAAAASSATGDAPTAWFHPCHWTAGADQVRMDDPSALPISAEDAQALHAIIAPWFAEDGLQLHIDSPARWRISGAPLGHLVGNASLDRVLLRDVRPWLPSGPHTRQLHRLQSEVQMLLYNHPFTDARAARGLPPINAFWLQGVGSLSNAEHSAVRQRQSACSVHVVDSLRQAALRQDWPAWKSAWLAADAGPLAQLAQHAAQGGRATLSLCGERHARSFTTAPRGLLGTIKNLWSRTSFKDLHQAL